MPASFFCRTTAKNVWKSVAGVSAAGFKRGRGRGTGRAIVKDLNLGQDIGIGRKKLLFPGMNSNIFSGASGSSIQELGEDQGLQAKVETLRARQNTQRKFRDKPIDRGWSGRKAHGRQAGPPAPHNETNFEGFTSTVLMLRPLLSMSGVLGRTKRMHALVVTGNGKGLAGFSTAIGRDPRSVVRHARNLAGQALVSVPLHENHTILHDFFSRYYFTTVFVHRKPKGYGIRAHRIIKAICQAFGITDIHAKVEGSTTNQINLTKAFFLGLMNQRKYQDMADEKRLHLVDLRQETYEYPTVLASPRSAIRTDEDIKASNENLDFTYFINDGKIKQIKAKQKPHFESHPMWYKHLDRLDYGKNREKTKVLLAAKYGDKKVKDVFPHFLSNADTFNRPS